MKDFSPQLFRQQFPLLMARQRSNLNESDNIKELIGDGIIYFDNAATSQKPQCVIECYQKYYQNYNANVHRASHSLSAQATNAFEKSREVIKDFINAKSIKEIIWTKGATESANLLATSLGQSEIEQGDEIIITVSEHHANIVPWQCMAEQYGAIIKVLPLTKDGRVDLKAYEALLNTKTKMVCCAHISNVIGKINPIKEIIQKARALDAITIIDGTQAISHLSIDVQALDCDFFFFSAHKMYGPTGVGVLYGKEKLLSQMKPYQTGGEMIKTVSFNQETTFNELPFKFEAGTPNIAGVIAYSKTIEFIQHYERKAMLSYEKSLIKYCYQALANIAEINFIVEGIPDIPIFSFTIKNQHNHDVAIMLNNYNIAIRSGHHCAMPLMEYLNIAGCIRVSLSPYNTFEEVDYFIMCLANIISASASQNTLMPQQSIETFSHHDILQQFISIKGWHSRHREIMLLSKKLPRLEMKERTENTLIQGCESLAWLTVHQDNNGIYHFKADSDAKIIRGLLVIVLAAFNDKTANEIQHFDINHYFEQLGLLEQLSPSRGNGLLAIVSRIKQLAH